MPLPCSPVSQSTASESQSLSNAGDSDDSLTTPRPGPADPSQRTLANLSKSSVPPSSAWARSRDSASSLGSPRREANHEAQSSPPSSSVIIPPSLEGDREERKSSLTFQPRTVSSRLNGETSYASRAMNASPTQKASAPRGVRGRLGKDTDTVAVESSADENTALSRKITGGKQNNYGSAGSQRPQDLFTGSEGVAEARNSLKSRKSGSVKSKSNSRCMDQTGLRRQGQIQSEEEEPEPVREGWLRSLVEKYGSVELENKGSVARDHLALERTFLAWLRTSLSFASIGIAVTQLFRLNTTIASNDPNTFLTITAANTKLRSVGKPLGATFLAISILILVLGFHRYFESQHYVVRGKFPASRGTIIIVSAVATALIVASLVVVVSISPEVFEKR